MDSSATSATARAPKKPDGLSYKFERLRERLRIAVSSGELSGKLPGERSLARRFHVNAKTLSKALTDLAAEGLLDRSIGRGTYVKAERSSAPAKLGRWLIVCEADRAVSPVLRYFREANPEAVVTHDFAALRPSFLKPFDAVIDFGISTPEAFLRSLVVRNVPVVAVNREPNLYSIHTVGTDRALGASMLARDLILGGHSHIAVIESKPRSVVGRAVKQAANRYGPQAIVQVIAQDKAIDAIREGATAIIADATNTARALRASLEASGIEIPRDVSLTAVGCCDETYPCSGQFVESKAIVESVMELLAGGGSDHRPATVWLAPRWVDCGTTRELPPMAGGEAA
jgi:DNA-binding transcriptional regulator YhcF (GntR family)